MAPHSVSEVMALLKPAFGKVIDDAEKVEELAFNYADMFVELPRLEERLRSIMENGTASSDDFLALRTFTVHWLYHLKEIDSLLSTISEKCSDSK